MARYSFSLKSKDNLKGVDTDLVAVVYLALYLSSVDFGVIEGRRTPERQQQLYAQGRTTPGPIVTYTLESKHLLGEAVDLAPVNPSTKKLDFEYEDGFMEIGRAMKEASAMLNIPIKWGWDWDNDGITQEKGEFDGPHFELV